MAEDRPVDPAWVIGFGAVLAVIFCFYLFIVSNWYWQCAAQIDGDTLAPVACDTHGPIQPPPEPATAANLPIEQQAWPRFGAGNRNYGNTGRFWGDDVVSQFFAQVFALAGRVAEPFVAETVVPGWNRWMESDVNRRTLLGALSIVLGALAKEWAKDIYRLLRRPKGDGASR